MTSVAGPPDYPPAWVLRVVALCLAVQALLGLEIDPYYFKKAGGTLALPDRTAVGLSCGALWALALCLVIRPLASLATLAAAVGVALLFVSCPFNANSFHLAQLVLLTVALIFLLVVLVRKQSAGLGPRLAARVILVLLAFPVVEAALTVTPRSHAVGYTLAARLWFKRHWNTPANSLGYRDVDHGEDGRRKLFVVGDSFVSAVGIADVKERFSDRLQQLVGKRYQVHNLGWNGADTPTELGLLKRHPFKPDLVVLSWYVNDILGAAAELGMETPTFHPYTNLPGPVAWLVPRSYLLDFAYWQLPQNDLKAQSDFLARCFGWKNVVERHQAQLQAFKDWTKERGIALAVVAFPHLAAPEATGSWLEPALEVFRRNGVPIVDVRELVRGQSSRRITVNANDSHPSPWLHARVAQALAELLERVDL